MKKPSALIALVVLSVLSAGIVLAEGVVKIGILDFSPFYVIEEGKEPTGLVLEALKIAMTKAGFAYEIKDYPPKRLYQNLAEGKSELFLGIKGVPELEDRVLYGRSKITTIDMRVYTRAETPTPKTKDELKGKKIIVIRGYSYGGFIKYLQDPANQIEVDESDNHEIAFKKLQAKRADYLLDYRQPADDAIKALTLTGVQNNSLSLLDIVIIVSKQTPNGQELVDKLERAFEELRKEGKLKDI